jgi:hypothetical protein
VAVCKEKFKGHRGMSEVKRRARGAVKEIIEGSEEERLGLINDTDVGSKD